MEAPPAGRGDKRDSKANWTGNFHKSRLRVDTQHFCLHSIHHTETCGFIELQEVGRFHLAEKYLPNSSTPWKRNANFLVED